MWEIRNGTTSRSNYSWVLTYCTFILLDKCWSAPIIELLYSYILCCFIESKTLICFTLTHGGVLRPHSRLSFSLVNAKERCFSFITTSPFLFMCTANFIIFEIRRFNIFIQNNLLTSKTDLLWTVQQCGFMNGWNNDLVYQRIKVNWRMHFFKNKSKRSAAISAC